MHHSSFCILLIFQSLIFRTIVIKALDDATVIVVGDSWAELGAAVLQQVFEMNNLTWKVANYVKGGTTTSDWSSNPNQVRNDVFKNENTAKFVWISRRE